MNAAPIENVQSAAAVRAFLAHCAARGFSHRTIERRAWSLRLWAAHVAPEFVGRVDVEQLESFLMRWPSPQSRQSVRSDVKMFYRWARKRGVIDCGDPCDDLPAPRLPKRAPTPVPPAVVVAMIDAAAGRTRLAIMLACFAGLRCSEIGCLRGEDVDIDGRRLVVRSGKGDKDAVVPIADELAVELARWPRHGPLVGLSGPEVGRHIRTLFRLHGVAHRPHDLRHSFGTQAAQATNGNVVIVSKLMRHADVSTTMRYVAWADIDNTVVTGMYGDLNDEPDVDPRSLS